MSKANAVERLEQIKQQLNLSPSPMSLQAPKDMQKERSSASFNIEALSHFWMGGKEKFERRVCVCVWVGGCLGFVGKYMMID